MAKQTLERTCTGGGGTHPKHALLRFVKGPENRIWFDVNGKAPGRGAYVFPSSDCLEKAFQKRGISRTLGAQVPETLRSEVESALYKQILQGLGLAKKSGHLVIGTEKVLAEAKNIQTLVLANDAAANTAAKLQNIPHTYRFGTQEDLSRVTGVANCVAVGILENGHVAPILKKYLALKA